MRRATAAVSAILLVMVSIAVAEAALLMLLVLFSYILRLNLAVQDGDQLLQLWAPLFTEPTVAVHTAGILGSILFTFGCGAGAGIRRYRRWSPS